MLIQTTTPRPVFSAQENPGRLRIFTLEKQGVSTGEVSYNLMVDLETGSRNEFNVEPHNLYPIPGAPGFQAKEFFIPLKKIFRSAPNTITALHTGSGVLIRIKSAFRSDTFNYSSRILILTLLIPVTGGTGVLRAADTQWDISISDLDFNLEDPSKQFDNSLSNSFSRVHQINPKEREIEARRLERINNVTLCLPAVENESERLVFTFQSRESLA